MSYRHAYHAGNFADVLKHAGLALALDALAKARAPFAVVDTHAGRGLYDLTSAEALRSGEHRHGAARVLAADDAPAALAPYRAALEALNPGGGAMMRYPGSPWLAARAMRARDRLVACELNPEEAAALEAALAGDPRLRVEAKDGYAALGRLLPPKAGRGLVLIDPPFERADEFDRLERAIAEAGRRWPAGALLVWLPLKDRAAAERLYAAAIGAGLRDAVAYALYVRDPVSGGGMAGCALLAVGLSPALEAPMAQALPWLARRLAQGPGARGEARRLTPA